MRLTRTLVATCAGIVMFGAGSAMADDVTESIDEALKAYNEGAYSESVESLNYALQLIQQKKGGVLAGLLPEPLSGWDADEVQSQAAGQGMFGGGVTAERSYRKGDASIDISMISDSPMLQGLMMMFSNPMFAGADGGKLERIKRQKAIVKYNKDDQSGEISIVVDNRFLITVKGRDTSLEDMRAYAEAIDYGKFGELP